MRQPTTQPRPLCDFPSGTAVTVTAIEGGAKARCRLCAMGLTPGSQVVVGGSGCGGGCCVRVRDTTITLGHGLAGKVLACPVGSAPMIVQPAPCTCKETA